MPRSASHTPTWQLLRRRPIKASRWDRHSAQPYHGWGEMDETGEVNGAAVVPGCEPAEMLEVPKATLDLIAMLVDSGVVRDEDLAIALGRDHRLGMQVGDPMA